MRNYVYSGDVVTLAAPYDVESGHGMLVGQLFAVATGKAANGVAVEARTVGVYDLVALNTSTASIGAYAYWDNTNKRVTDASSGNKLIGVFMVAKTNGQTVARVRLNGAA